MPLCETVLCLFLPLVQILIIVPCTVAYHVELLWKHDFLRTQARTPDADVSDATSRTKPWFLSPLWVTFDIVCLALLVCESIAQLAPALQCECHAQY
jgi:hypothetical protein